jgi:DNA-binding MarR family transcriptional regulator/ribosomal protein S18 acetylase RimI-like enzyme
MTDPAPHHVARLRAFNRFHTRLVGALKDDHLQSALPLPQIRVLWELGTDGPLTASALGARLGLDKGYMSRLVTALTGSGMIAPEAGATGRGRPLALTAEGEALHARMVAASSAEAAGLLARLPAHGHDRVDAAAAILRAGLGGAADLSVKIRGLRPGDMGEVIAAHGRLYAAEYGWDATFEALVARICADFLDAPGQDRQWAGIVDAEGMVAGSTFVVDGSEGRAKVRLVYVEPQLRGRGLARRMLDEATAFARGAGYDSMILWTQSCLGAARRMYAGAGFTLIGEEPHHSFGTDLVGETWVRPL